MKKEYGSKLVILLFIFCFSFFYSRIDELNRNSMYLIALFFEIFLTFPISLKFFYPLSKIIAEKQYLNLFWLLFVVRVIFLFFFTFFVSEMVFLFDFLFFFVAVFGILPFLRRKNSYQIKMGKSDASQTFIDNFLRNNPNEKNLLIRCAKCGKTLKVTDQVCPNCGAPFRGNNVTVEFKQEADRETHPKDLVYKNQFDLIYQLSEDEMVEEFIRRKMVKAGIDDKKRSLPKEIVQRKKFTYVLFCFSLFAYLSLIFFHLPFLIYVFGFFFFFVFLMEEKFNWMDYFKEKVKARPKENVFQMMMDVKQTCILDSSWKFLLIGLILSIGLPFLFFAKPRIFYEKVDQGYAVKFYTIGLLNATKITIPESYRKEPVVKLNDGVFSDIYFLKEVTLPDTIVDIGSYAFKNDRSLSQIPLSNNLRNLGEGAFLQCSSLEKVVLPDSVVQIGHSAFARCVNLKSVVISPNSLLEKIDPLAFSYCYLLDTIQLPANTIVNETAFQGSPTRIEFSLSSSFQKKRRLIESF